MQFSELSPVLQALIGTLFTWLMTALGAATIFLLSPAHPQAAGRHAGLCRRRHDRRQLLVPDSPRPSILSNGSWIPAVVGFLLGGAFLRGIDIYPAPSARL